MLPNLTPFLPPVLSNPDRILRCRQHGVFLCLLLVLCAALAGCGMTEKTTPAAPTGYAIPGVRGLVHGGQQPLTGARVYLYATSTTFGGASTSLLNEPGFVLTDLAGGFNITGAYTCPANSYVYLLAVGGNPGLPNVTNPYIAVGAGLGLCSSLSSTPFLTVNEVTTVTMTSALAAFATSETQIGFSNLSQPFATIAQSSNAATGMALASGNTAVVPQAAINTLANALAACINSSGVGAPCSTLFAAANVVAGGSGPVDTFQAALNIAKYPGNNVAAIYNLAAPSSVFAPTLPAAPASWNVAPASLGSAGCIAADANTYRVSTTKGDLYVELRPDVAPQNVANFLSYVNSGAYSSSILHRLVPGFVLQGGGYKYNGSGQIIGIPTNAPVVSEVKLSNLRGTLAMALAGAPNTATNQFFLNLVDNPSLDTQSGGYTVIGQFANVAGVDKVTTAAGLCGGYADSLAVMDLIGQDTVVNAGSPFDSLPVTNYAAGQAIQPANLEYVNSISPVTNVLTTPATPLFSPNNGYSTNTSSVVITDTTNGAVIYYSTCTANSTSCTPFAVYPGGPVTIPSGGLVQAYATAANLPNQSVTSAIVGP